MLLTPSQLISVMPRLRSQKSLVNLYLPQINEALEEFDIDTPARIAAFLAQLAHESGQLRYMEEIASGAAYERRKDLGNTKPEAIAAAKRAGTTPGRFYKGHGPIQLTGYNNHKLYGDELGVDFVNDPELAASPEHGFRVAGLYWKKNGLNALADRNTDIAFKQITKRINGGYNGLADRREYWARAKKVLGNTVPEARADRSDVADKTRPAVSTTPVLLSQGNQSGEAAASEPIPPEQQPPADQPNVNIQQAGGVTIEPKAPVPENADPNNIVKVTAGSGSWIRTVLAWFGTVGSMASDHVASAFGLSPEIQKILIFAAIGGGALYLVLKWAAERQVRTIASDPGKSSVK